MNQNNTSQNNCLNELRTILPNVQSTLYTALFCQNKLSEPLDSLIFGFFMGFLSSRKEIKITESCLPELLQIYFKCTTSTKTFEDLLQILSLELTSYLYKNNIDSNSIGKNNSNDINNIIPINNIYIDPEEEEEKEEVLLEKCKICLTDYNIYDISNYGLGCGCIVHNQCFDDHVKSRVTSNLLPVKCPLCNKDINSCFIMDSLTYNNPNLLDKYERFTLNMFSNNNKDVKNCPTAGCNYMFFYKPQDTEFSCPMCNKSYCLKCHVDWHSSKTCEQYRAFINEKNENQFFTFARNKNFKRCPFCFMWVERLDGTFGNQMHCRCGNDFCFQCGGEYQNNHICYYLNPNKYVYFPVKNPTKKGKKRLRKQQVLNRYTGINDYEN